MNIPPDVEYKVDDCPFRVPEEDVPAHLLPQLEKCLRAENAYCDLDGNFKKYRKKRKGNDNV